MHSRRQAVLQDARIDATIRDDGVNTTPNYLRDLTTALSTDEPRDQTIDRLRLLQRNGVSQASVQHWLEELRAETDDELVEDRILEVLDVVTGFCSAENRVWEAEI